MPTVDELRLRVRPEGLTAATTKFKSALHPRGRDGRFIEVGALIRFFEGKNQGTGKVDSITEGDNGTAVVHVTDNGGKPHTLRPDQIDSAKRVKATIGEKAAEGMRRAAESNADVDERRTALRGRVHQNMAEREQAVNAPGPGIPGVTGGTGTKEDPYVVTDVDAAAQLLEQGKHIQMNQPDEVATLLDKLKEIVDDARAKGEKAPSYDLCKVSVPKTNLFCVESKHIPRNHMPQLSGTPTPGSEADKLPKNDKGEVDLSQPFVDYLAGRGIKVTDEKRLASHLRASQNQLEGGKVAGMADALENGTLPPGAIFVTRDGYVVDGHHRWAANIGTQLKTGEDMEMDVRVIDADIMQVLAIADNFSDSLGIPKASVTGDRSSPVADEAFRKLENEGGFTVTPTAAGTGIISPKTGYVVAVDPADNMPVVLGPDITSDRVKYKAALAKWLADAAEKRKRNPNFHFGAWADDENGKVYFDIVEVMQDQAEAEAAGRDRNQIAIWDLANQTEINTGGSGDVPVAAGGNDERHESDTTAGSTGPGLRDPGLGHDGRGGEGRVPGGDARQARSAPGRTLDRDTPALVARAFSAKERKKASGTGAAMPDGSFPINNEQDLRNAVKAYGRAKNQAAAKRHIISRAKSLGKVGLLPDDWKKSLQAAILAASWNSALHPRDRSGQFIEIGALVRFFKDGKTKPHTGRVVAIDGDGDAATIRVQDEKSMQEIDLRPDNIAEAVETKGTLKRAAQLPPGFGSRNPDSPGWLAEVSMQTGIPMGDARLQKMQDAARAKFRETRRKLHEHFAIDFSDPVAASAAAPPPPMAASGDTIMEDQPLVALGFNPLLHPRARDGKFIKVGAHVRFNNGGSIETGVVTKVVRNTLDQTAPVVSVDLDKPDMFTGDTKAQVYGHDIYEVIDEKATLKKKLNASALLAGGSTVKAESPYLTEDGMSWNGEALPDTVKAALTAPMGKVSSPGAAEALNALYQSLVLSTGGQVPLDSLVAQVTELDTVAEADGTDGGDAKALQKASKLVRTIFAIPDQADLDKAQEKANSKAASMGKPKAAAPAEAEAEKAEPAPDAETPADAASEAAVPAAPVAASASLQALRDRVHA